MLSGLVVQGLLWALGKLLKAIDGLIVTQKEAAEAAEEAVKAYEEQSSKLNDLTKKLEESKKRYKELYDIQQTSSLTFVEEELDKLKETNKQLELQIANEKELQQIKVEEANEKLTKAFGKQSYTSIAYENAVYDYNALKAKHTEPFVHGRGKRKSELQREIEEYEALLTRKVKYESYQDTFDGRNSFSKTDKDATFMHMKDDHMRNAQLKPGYINLNNRIFFVEKLLQTRSNLYIIQVYNWYVYRIYTY